MQEMRDSRERRATGMAKRQKNESGMGTKERGEGQKRAGSNVKGKN